MRRLLRRLETQSIFITSSISSRLCRLLLRSWGARIGPNVHFHHGLIVRCARRIEIESDCLISENVSLDGRGGLVIQQSTSVNAGVQIWTADHDPHGDNFAYRSGGVTINDHVWLSSRSIVLPGVIIGKGAVVSAGSVVTRDVPDKGIVGGVPARQIASRRSNLQYLLDPARSRTW